MKKKFNILLFLSLLLVLNVKADMGPPALPQLEMEVSNPDGAKCYDSESKVNRTLKYGELAYGHIDDTDLYDDNFRKDYYKLSFNEKEVVSCYVKKTDVVVKQDNFKPSEDDKEEGPFALWALKDMKIYSGPSKNFYKEVGAIPKDSKLESSYKLGDYWYYVEYNGIKGYTSSEGGAIVVHIEPEIVVTYDKTPIFDHEFDYGTTKDSKIIDTIPANKELKVEWGTDYSRNNYIEYNGKYGFVYNHYSFANKCDGTKIKAKKSVKVYESLDYDDNGKLISKELGTIDSNKDYDVKYCGGGQGWNAYYITSKNGWINENHEDRYIIETDSKGEVFDHTKEGIFLEKIEIKGHSIDFSKTQYSYTVELSEEETKLEFVVTPNEVEVDVLNNEDLKNNSVVTLKAKDEDGTHTYTFKIVKAEKPGDVQPPTPKEEPTPDDKKGLTNEELIMICVGAGILIAVTILVVIKLVNKKKNSEVDPIQNNNDNSNLE